MPHRGGEHAREAVAARVACRARLPAGLDGGADLDHSDRLLRRRPDRGRRLDRATCGLAARAASLRLDLGVGLLLRSRLERRPLAAQPLIDLPQDLGIADAAPLATVDAVDLAVGIGLVRPAA